ncbi:unnamed protein product [Haemonchus placei]|uniref:Uncharacterized protein n=1 Tax=Haemonchus placei TaxID=6290 RepID=A0A3P7TKH5_HAEPC|nr:unnamed protein product [Haemonchus placei]
MYCGGSFSCSGGSSGHGEPRSMLIVEPTFKHSFRVVTLVAIGIFHSPRPVARLVATHRRPVARLVVDYERCH